MRKILDGTLYYLHALVGTESVRHRIHAFPVLVVDSFPSTLRCEYGAVLAEPPRARQVVRLLLRIVAPPLFYL